MKKVSLKNIAEKVGVSNATVSLVLSGKEKEGRVSKEMADKIRQVAKDLNYQPNNLARSLRMGRSQTIGLIIADISNSFFGSLAFYIQEQAEKFGYTVIITNTNESVDKMNTMINTLTNRQVDGFIIVPTENGEEEIKRLVKNGTPLVLLDRYFPFVPTSYVVIDNYRSSLDATKLLIEKGCRNIVLFSYHNNLPHVQERKSGYLDALIYAGLSEKACVKEVRYSNLNDDIESAVKDLFGTGDHQIDGVLFATNSISMIGLKCMSQLKVGIADNVKVVCFDKNEAFDFIPISIPYVLQPIKEMAHKAVDILIDQIEHENTRVVEVKLSTQLIENTV